MLCLAIFEGSRGGGGGGGGYCTEEFADQGEKTKTKKFEGEVWEPREEEDLLEKLNVMAVEGEGFS